MSKPQQGFTLIEVMVVVAVIAILSAIAIPSYTQYVTKARRSDARVSLMKLAQLQEAYYSSNNQYALTFTNLLTASTEGFTSVSGTTLISLQTYYSISLSPAATRNFTLTATPTTDMATREASMSISCKGFSLDSTGQRGVTGGGTGSLQDCWG